MSVRIIFKRIFWDFTRIIPFSCRTINIGGPEEQNGVLKETLKSTLTLSDYISYKILITFNCYLSAQGYWFLVVGCWFL